MNRARPAQAAVDPSPAQGPPRRRREPLRVREGAVPIPRDPAGTRWSDLEAPAGPVDIVTRDPAAVVSVGSLEGYQASSMELVEKLEAAGSNATYLLLEGQDHKDTALSLADPDSELFEAVLRLISQ